MGIWRWKLPFEKLWTMESALHNIYDVSQNFAEDSLLHYATDGESYGHHHRYGEMVLAYSFKRWMKWKTQNLLNMQLIYIVFHQRINPCSRAFLLVLCSWSGSMWSGSVGV